MTKQDLRGQLQTIKNNYALSEVGVILMAQTDAAKRMAENFEMSALFPDFKHVDYIKYRFKDAESLKHSLKEFRGAALRTVIKETFESVKDYCSKTNQTTVFCAAPWYQFMRVIRNCLSHDLIIRYKDNDIAKLPISWGGLTLCLEMKDSPLQAHGFFNREKALCLIDEIITYVDLQLQ